MFSDLESLTKIQEPPIEKPDIRKPVIAVVEHWHTKGLRYAVLMAVDEDDHDYITVDDNSELSHDWSVVSWIYLPELT